MALQEKLYEAVETATAGLFDEREDYISAREKAAKDSAEITKAYMKGFAWWMDDNYVKLNEVYYSVDDIKNLTLHDLKGFCIDELIEHLTEKQ